MSDRHLHIVPDPEPEPETAVCWSCFKDLPAWEPGEEPICEECWLGLNPA